MENRRRAQAAKAPTGGAGGGGEDEDADADAIFASLDHKAPPALARQPSGGSDVGDWDADPPESPLEFTAPPRAAPQQQPRRMPAPPRRPAPAGVDRVDAAELPTTDSLAPSAASRGRSAEGVRDRTNEGLRDRTNEALRPLSRELSRTGSRGGSRQSDLLPNAPVGSMAGMFNDAAPPAGLFNFDPSSPVPAVQKQVVQKLAAAEEAAAAGAVQEMEEAAVAEAAEAAAERRVARAAEADKPVEQRPYLKPSAGGTVEGLVRGTRSEEKGLAAANLTASEMRQRIAMLEAELGRSEQRDATQAELMAGAERSFTAMCDDLRVRAAGRRLSCAAPRASLRPLCAR